MKLWYIVDVFREIVGKVSAKLTPQLKGYDELITGVHYEHGHPMEVIETLNQKDASETYQFDKYPLIALFQDFPERVSDNTGIQSEATLHLIIARATKADFKAAERYDYNFRPVLYPVYEELLYQIHRHPAIISKGPALIRHTKYDRLYWGRQGLYGNEGNIFNDRIDCIEIRDLQLKFNQKIC